jgi:predicted TIM-barrel fold metal-dependent hydrolase
MRIIDMHAHVFPEKIAAAAIDSLEGEGGVIAYYDGTVAGLVEAMDRAGVERSLIAPVATKPSQVESINDWVISLDRSRIIPFGAMHPEFDDPAAEMARLAEAGIKGFKLHSHDQDFCPDEGRMGRIYRAAVEAGMVILFHAGGFPVAHGFESRPEHFARLLDAHPDLTCILAHMGSYLFWDEVREYLCGRDVYFDTAYVPGNLPDVEFLALMRDHGIEKILFGSDGPWTDVAAEIDHMRGLRLAPAEQEAVFGGNALRLLGEA